MAIRKHITALVMVLVLHPVAVAWAEGEAPSPPATSPRQQEAQQSRKQPSETAGRQAPAPLVEKIQSSPSDTSSKPDAAGPERGFIDVLHGGISEGLLTTAGWLDSFFGDERYVLEENRSYIRVRYDIFQEERSNLLLRPAVDLRLILPQLQKKTHLVFSAEPTEPPKGAGTPVTATGERIATTTERNVTTALNYFFRSTPGESFIVRTGVQLSHGKPVLFAAPRYRSLRSLDSWDLRFTQEALYRTDTGWQTDTLVDLERKLQHDLFFRTSIEGAWYANTNGYFYSLSFSLRQAFDANHALDYEWVNSYQSRPVDELTEIAFRVRYRHSVWKQWIFFELAPQVRYPRDRNFDLTPGILFRLEMFFGQQA